MKFLKLSLLTVLALAAVATISAQSLEQRRADFTKLKFGMFIHFNMGTFHEQEWVLPGRDPATFNPVKLDCGQWADAAKRAGMKYAVLTTKHHDGFCLWDSQTTTYDVAASPLKGRDIVREYCDAFRQRGIEPHFYFSIWDRQLGIEKRITPAEIDLIKAQLTELLTHYGKIGSLTFDGWGNCGTEWTQADRDMIYAHVKSLQPQILVTDHYQLRRKLPLKEVYQVVDFFHYEEPIGEWAPAGNVFVSQQGPTLQSAWFWKLKFPSEGLMSVDDIVEKHLKVLNTRNCNFLLNCAPNRDGLLDENVVRRLAEVGKAWQLAGSGTNAPTWGDWQQWGDQGDGTYRNPVLPADYSDLDCIRVGSDYYAIASTFQYSPGMVILQSRDLVNWRMAGHAVPDVTQISPEMNWDRMNRFGTGIWAGAIRHHAGKFWVYFGTPDEGYFMTTATNIAGPWSPLTHVLKARGWDDCCPFWDDDGQGYLIGSQFDKDPVNGKKYNIHLWELSADGKSLVTESDKILYQSNGSEANKLYKWNGTYYHYFSEVRAEGRVPMMGRATNIAGPYEYRQIGHVKKGVDYEPNQGGIVQSEAGDWWFFTHHGAGDWSGRIASLLPVTWTNGWPIIGEVGADGIGNMVWSAHKPVNNSSRVTPQTDDEFSSAPLSVQWEWHYQPRVEKWSLTERPGFLRLHAFRGLHGDNLLKVGNVLTQRPFRAATNVVTVKMEVDGMADGQSAGLFHYTTAGYAGVGVSQSNGVRQLIYRSGLNVERGAGVKGASVWLRSTWGLDGVCRFARGLDGKTFEPIGAPYQMKWASYRGDRIGLFTYNNAADAGYVDFDSFRYEYSGQEKVAAGILPAVEPGFQAGGRSVGTGGVQENPKTSISTNASPGGKMPPSTSGKMPDATSSANDADVLLFTYFRNNGADGVHLAMTTNSVDFSALNNDQPIFKPPQWPGQNLTRDASVLYRDGKFRMVWTSGWKGRVFGYAESDDLVHWSEPRQVKPFPDSLPAEDQPDNIWAPEIHFDPLKQDYFILFASSTPRERNDDDDSNNNGKRGSQYDNRVFITRTKDFQTWSAAKIFFDRDFASIDAVMRRDEANQRWVMVIKCSRDETLAKMPGRNLWLTFTGLDLDKLDFSPLEGPIAGNHSPMFSDPAPRKSMAEGPSLLWVDNRWLLAWDEPAGGGVQLATSPDLKMWTHLKSAKFPHPAQHGTLFLAPRNVVGWLTQTNLSRGLN